MRLQISVTRLKYIESLIAQPLKLKRNIRSQIVSYHTHAYTHKWNRIESSQVKSHTYTHRKVHAFFYSSWDWTSTRLFRAAHCILLLYLNITVIQWLYVINFILLIFTTITIGLRSGFFTYLREIEGDFSKCWSTICHTSKLLKVKDREKCFWPTEWLNFIRIFMLMNNGAVVEVGFYKGGLPDFTVERPCWVSCQSG